MVGVRWKLDMSWWWLNGMVGVRRKVGVRYLHTFACHGRAYYIPVPSSATLRSKCRMGPEELPFSSQLVAAVMN